MGDYANAASEARVVLAADRFNLDAQLLLASALAGVRRFAEAEERLRAAIASAPQDPRVYKALSTLQLRRGNSQAAEASLLQAIKLDPSIADARVSLAQLYLETGRAADGEKQLRAALEIAPEDVGANRTYASYLVTTEDCADAEKYWQMVAAKSPDDSGNLSLADYYVWSGRSDDALRVLAKVSSKDTGGAAKVRVASILYDRGEHSKAATIVDELLAHDQASVNGLVLKARMSLESGDAASAREYAHRAAEVDPDAPAVRDMLAHVNTQP
jgi:Tfp pilus assembly protein PilF